MDSSIKINSISIDLADDVDKEIDRGKCNHFSIREYAAEARERDYKKSWPFSEKSVCLLENQSYSLPSMSVRKFRYWCCSCGSRDHGVDGTKECGHSNSRTISEMKLDGNSSVIPSKSLTAVFDHHKIAGNVVEENEDVNFERIEKDDHTIAQTNAADKILKKVRPRSKDARNLRSKSRKLASPEQVGNKKPREKVKKPSMNVRILKEKQNVDQAVTTFGEIAGVIEDTPPRVIKKHKGRSRRRRKLKSTNYRLLSELVDDEGNTKTSGGDSNIRKEESASKGESVRGRKRKWLLESNDVIRLSKISTTSENASKGYDHSDQGDGESTDSEFDRDPIKGKKKNRRFQIVDEFVPSLSQEGIPESDAEPGRGALSSPVHSNGKDSVPLPLSTQIREKKKKLNLSKKKKKKPVTANKKSKLLSSSAGVDEGKQVKTRTGPPVNAISQSTQDLSNEEMASEGYFRKSIPHQPNDKQVVPLHLQDNDLLRSRNAEANCLRVFGSSSKSNTGGWLRTGVDVVDLSCNNNTTNRSCSPNSTLIRPTSSPTEVADLSCVLQKDASGADRKGKTVVVQEHQEAHISQNHHTKENTPEEQNDEIPMDIVELMAKIQYERCLPDKEEDVSNKQPSQETPHKSKNALMIDLNETYDNGISQEDNNTSRYPKPCDMNARKEEHFPIRNQQQSLEFFPISKPYVSSPFGIFPPSQENRASSIRFSGQNSQWPTMANQNPSPSSFRVLRACDTCQSVPHQHREASHLVWPPSVIPQQCHQHKPDSFNMYQSTNSQASNNGNAWNLNFVAANGKQIFGPSSELSFCCKQTGGRTMDRFSSESSIPAFHLHSRMDPRLNSNTHTDHHGNTKFPRRHFPPVHQTREFIELHTGDSSKTAYPINQLPFDFHRKRYAPETSRNSFPIIPSSFSFQNAQASWSHHQEKETKRRESYPPVYNNSQVFGSSSNDQTKFQLLGASNSMMRPLKSHMTDNEKKQKRKAEDVKNASALPQKNSSERMACSINRNPADFTIPEPGNVYMLTGENLKVRRWATYKRKQSLCKQDALKQTKKPVRSATENA